MTVRPEARPAGERNEIGRSRVTTGREFPTDGGYPVSVETSWIVDELQQQIQSLIADIGELQHELREQKRHIDELESKLRQVKATCDHRDYVRP